MKTIKLNIKIPDEWKSLVEQDQRIYSSCVRYSFNRLKEKDASMTKLYRDTFSKFNIGSHFITSANREAKGIIARFKEVPKFHFGGSAQSKLYKGLITKKDYKKARNLGLFSEGESVHKGNRHFKLNLDNKTVIYKRSRKEHIPLIINQYISPKRRNLLESIYISMENKISPVTFKIKGDNVYITYDETVVEKYKQFKGLKENRVLGIDLNPNYFGISVIEFFNETDFKVVHKEVIDISSLNEQSTGKVKFEIKQINCRIIKLCDYFKCSTFAVEELNFKKSNKFWSKSLNRLCRNKFRYSTIKHHLQTLCNTYGVKFVEVNAAYSSFIGNLNYGSHNCPDMIAASIEIARRGYKKYLKGWFYPALNKERIKEVLMNLWKKDLELNFNSWKELFNQIKKSKIMYRFQLDGSKAVFRKFYRKTYIENYIFI